MVRDSDALAQLFEDGAVLVAAGGPREAGGAEEIARLAAAMWERNRTYLADPRRVLQARDTALVIAERGINVLRRGSDGIWRFAIALLDIDDTTPREQQ